MLEMQGAIGRIQLGRMEDWTAARNANASAIRTTLEPFAGPLGPIRLPAFACADCPGCDAAGGCIHAHYKFYAYARPENLAPDWSRDRIVAEITAQGVPCYQGSCSEVYLERAFDGTGWRPETRLPVAQELGETSLMFLVHPTLTAEEIAKTCRVIQGVLEQAGQC